MNIDFDNAHGAVSIRGIRYLLIQPATLVGFQKAAEAAMGARAAELLHAGGCEGGRRSSRRLRELSALQGGAFAQEYLSMGDRIGWGVFRVTRFDERSFDVEVSGSPFAEAYGPATAPVCHFTRGVIAGLGETTYGGATVEETACAAQGAPVCRFVARAG